MAKMEEKVDKDYDNKSYGEQVRDFNLSRTPFGISICGQLLATIIPGLVIGLLIGPDGVSFAKNPDGTHGIANLVQKSFNFFGGHGNGQIAYSEFTSVNFHSFSDHGIGFVAMISCFYLVGAMLVCTITYLLKGQKSDCFTYTMAFAFIGFLIIMNGGGEYDGKNGGAPQSQGVRVITDFVICLFGMLLGLFLGVIVTTFARNRNYKIEEDDEAILIAYENGEEVPTKKQLRIERAKKAKAKREAEAKELDMFKASLDEKIEQNFIENQKRREEEEDLTPEQLKQLKKERKAQAKKDKIFAKKNKHSDSKEIHGLD